MEFDANEADSSDVIDRRGAAGGAGGSLGGGMSLPGGFSLPGGRAGGGVVGLIVIVVLAFLGKGLLGGSGFDVDTGSLGSNVFPGGAGPADQGDVAGAAIPADQDPDLQLKTLSNVVISDLNRSWASYFGDVDRQYRKTKLVLYTGATPTACGTGQSAMGPFYCPPDSLVYIDLAFFQELSTRFSSPGDFAIAYVIAHEVGHHVQNLLGISDRVTELQRDNPDDANSLSVRLELQADCLAGVWAHSRYERGQSDPTKRLDDGDIAEALHAAEQIGDDTLQKEATGRIRPEQFTHGTSAQREQWLKTGYDSGRADDCDTFSVDEP